MPLRNRIMVTIQDIRATLNVGVRVEVRGHFTDEVMETHRMGYLPQIILMHCVRVTSRTKVSDLFHHWSLNDAVHLCTLFLALREHWFGVIFDDHLMSK